MLESKLTELQRNILDCVSNGLTTKEIVQKLNCSESSVKQTRANKKLNKQYKNNYHNNIMSVISLSIERIEKILNDPNARNDEIIQAGKQLVELAKLREEVKPPQDIEIRVVYVSPKDGEEHQDDSV